jgi:hypothetical protein
VPHTSLAQAFVRRPSSSGHAARLGVRSRWLAPSCGLAALLVLSACGDDDGATPPPEDGSLPDAAVPDEGVDLGAAVDASPADAGPTVRPPPFVRGEPIRAPDRTWTWVDVPEARCQDGSPTGFGVSPSSTSTRLVIYLEGGGACFNDATCMTVANPNGYGARDFGGGPRGPLFDRDDPGNPFRDFDMVYVPYCSGDIYAGYRPEPVVVAPGIPRKTFVGYANVGHFLSRIVPTFEGAELVVITGSSAGGFGAAYNFDRTVAAFAPSPVHLLDDSGPIFSPTYIRPCLQDRLRTLWNLDGTLPEDCVSCRAPGTGLSSAFEFVVRKHSRSRVALLSATRDAVIRYFMGFGLSEDCNTSENFRGVDFEAALREVRETTLRDATNFSTWYIASDAHTWLNVRADTYLAPGMPPVPLRAFMADFIEGAGAYRHVGP